MMREGATLQRVLPGLIGFGLLWCAPIARSQSVSVADGRLWTMPYSDTAIYELKGAPGYQIDLEFESGERVTGVSAGHLAGLALASVENHLFLKPRAKRVLTNVVVFTNRRQYQLHYVATGEAQPAPTLFRLRFLYPPASGPRSPAAVADPSVDLKPAVSADAVPRLNRQYECHGTSGIAPVAVWDDGVRTYMQFGIHVEWPAVFVVTKDGTESLADFHVEGGLLVLHRVADQWILRRGKARAWVVNHGEYGSAIAQRPVVRGGESHAND